MELWPIYIFICFGVIHCIYLLYLKSINKKNPELIISKSIIALAIFTGLIMGLIYSGSSLGENSSFLVVMLLSAILTPLALIGLVHFFFTAQLIFWLPIKGLYSVFNKS